MLLYFATTVVTYFLIKFIRGWYRQAAVLAIAKANKGSDLRWQRKFWRAHGRAPDRRDWDDHFAFEQDSGEGEYSYRRDPTLEHNHRLMRSHRH